VIFFLDTIIDILWDRLFDICFESYLYLYLDMVFDKFSNRLFDMQFNRVLANVCNIVELSVMYCLV
jgi:hypothetical protein